MRVEPPHNLTIAHIREDLYGPPVFGKDARQLVHINLLAPPHPCIDRWTPQPHGIATTCPLPPAPTPYAPTDACVEATRPIPNPQLGDPTQPCATPPSPPPAPAPILVSAAPPGTLGHLLDVFA